VKGIIFMECMYSLPWNLGDEVISSTRITPNVVGFQVAKSVRLYQST
jgi:hypothetical protein